MARPRRPAVVEREAYALCGDSHLPLYRRLYLAFAEQIAAGVLKPGDSLPAEADIARRYTLAPGTVRRAMQDLADKGLIDRIHGRGTFVRRPNFDHAMLRFLRFRDSGGAVIHPESRIVARRIIPIPAQLGAKLATAERTVLHMVRHRLWDGAVRLIEDIYLPEHRFIRLLDASPEEVGPLLYPAYERLCGQLVCGIEEEIAMTEATAEDAAALGLAPGSLVVSIERLARDATGRPLEWRLSRAEAKRFRYRVSSDQF